MKPFVRSIFAFAVVSLIPFTLNGSWFEPSTTTGENRVESEWFGGIELDASGWIKSDAWGWLWPVEDADNGVFLWEPTLGWLWTTSEVYPTLYRITRRYWVYYLGRPDPHGPRWFYDFRTGHYRPLPDEREVIPTDSLVLFMKFDESYDDESGNGHFAELINARGITPRFMDGKFGKAIQLVNHSNIADSEMVRVDPSPVITEMVEAGMMTLSMWASHGIDRYEQAYLGISAVPGGPPSSKSHFYVKNWHDGEVRVTSAPRPGVLGEARTRKDAFKIREWFHLAVTVDGYHVAFYINGEKFAPPFFSNNPWEDPLNRFHELNDLLHKDEISLYVGGRAGEFVGFHGLIDQVRLYNRILSAAEIKALANE